MRISTADAADHLMDLVERAEAGEEIVLTDGEFAVRLVPIPPESDERQRGERRDK